MHVPFVSLALALTLIAAAIASKETGVNWPRQGTTTTPNIMYCTEDDYLAPLQSYLPITADATSFCSHLFGITNVKLTVATVTPTEWVQTP